VCSVEMVTYISYILPAIRTDASASGKLVIVRYFPVNCKVIPDV
jgi:hypothetical protein